MRGVHVQVAGPARHERPCPPIAISPGADGLDLLATHLTMPARRLLDATLRLASHEHSTPENASRYDGEHDEEDTGAAGEARPRVPGADRRHPRICDGATAPGCA